MSGRKKIFLLFCAIFIGFYAAWCIGANDVANSIATVVGSKYLTLRRAIVIAAIFEFCGAVFVGSHVTNTVRKGIIDITFFSDTPILLAYGMFAALLSSALFMHAATFFGMPVSTTHSIVGSVFGFGLIAAGAGSLHWHKILSISGGWILSPFFGGFMSFMLFKIIRKYVLAKERPYEAVLNVAPILVLMLFSILILSVIYKGLKNLHLDLPFARAFIFSSCVGVAGALITWCILKLKKTKLSDDKGVQYREIEKIFGVLQLFTCSYIAFAHGANDVANAIGPLAAIVSIVKTNTVVMKVSVPMWILILGGTGIVTGLATYGYKVVETIGEKITELTPSRGFSAEFGAATTVLLCSKMGLPISTTHTMVGAVIGVGYARGIATMNFAIIRKILYSWIITIPLAAVVTVLFYKAIVAIFC